MSPSSVSPALKALQYAENELGVNTVYEAAQKTRDELDELLTRLSVTRDEKRSADITLDDRQMEIASDERGKHADMSEAGMARHLKVAYFEDEFCKKLRIGILDLGNQIEGMEFDKSILEYSLKISVARMTELGGYMQYLAAIKLSTI